MRPFFPALLVALFAGWCGTLGWGGLGAASVTGALVLLGAVAVAAPSWSELCDPLRLVVGEGGWHGILPWALWGWCLGSAALSPVPRSGRVALILLPAYFLLPGVVARCLESERDRRLAARSLALAATALSLWALGDWLLLGSPRPAMPLGHHNLLALVLVALLPLAALAARELGGWRWLGRVALGLLVGTLVASRSLAGLAALGVQAGVLLLVPQGRSEGKARRRRASRGLGLSALILLLLVLAAGWGGARLLRIAQGVDPSLRARGVYWRAGLAGVETRPLVGWGPGSTPWTLAAFLHPLPGVNPPGEGVGELHNLPLALAYELGLPGALLSLALCGLFLRARLRHLRDAASPGEEGEEGAGRRAGSLAGVLAGIGAGVAFLGSASLAVTALPVALAVAAGFAMGPLRSKDSEQGVARRAWAGLLYSAVALALLAPILAAQLRYDQARSASSRGDGAAALRALAGASTLDGSFPLYRWRLALARDSRGAGGSEAADQALRAARGARGIPLLWEGAGILGARVGRAWAPRALAQAEALDPMSALAPFWLARLGGTATAPGNPGASGARALLGEPRLLRACYWLGEPAQLDTALADLVRWPGVDAGWKEAMLAAVRRSRAAVEGVGAEETGQLVLSVDTRDDSSISIHLFHRRPWPLRWPVVPLCGPDDQADLPAAWELSTTSPSALRGSWTGSRSVDEQDLLTH